MKKTTNISAFIEPFPQDVQEKLEWIRNTIKQMAPDAVEAISYGIPTFKLNGNLIHFAAYKNHIGLYPGADGIAQFAHKFGKYSYSKGTVQFPIDEPLPKELIKEIVQYRIHKQKSRPKRSASKKK